MVARRQISKSKEMVRSSRRVSLLCLDAMTVIEAKNDQKHGGLDFETNIEWLFTNLVECAVGSRVDFFKSMMEEHSLAAKKSNRRDVRSEYSTP